MKYNDQSQQYSLLIMRRSTTENEGIESDRLKSGNELPNTWRNFALYIQGGPHPQKSKPLSGIIIKSY